jgi:hypothetical protein
MFSIVSGFRGVIDTAEIHCLSNIYLVEYEAICKTALAHKSGAKVGLIDEKVEGRKSRATVPLSNIPLA